MNFHVGQIAVVLVVTVWVVQLYLTYVQWSNYNQNRSIVNGWNILDPGMMLWNTEVNQISKSLGPDGDGGRKGWCTDCGPRSASRKPCPSTCHGVAGRTTDGSVVPGNVVPNGTGGIQNGTEGCQALCRKQYNDALKTPDSDIPLANACQAWEWDDVSKTCFTYVLSSYPPFTSSTDGLTSITAGYAVDTYTNRSLLRQLAAAMVLAAPMALFYVSYNNYYYPSSNMNVALTTLLPLFAGIAGMAFVGFVGFDVSSPAMQFSCNEALNQKCQPDALTGGRRSGSCYNGCCGLSISCPMGGDPNNRVWSTCTWPNVMCSDGTCALNADACSNDTGRGATSKSHGGIYSTDGVCTSGGNPAIDGGDYGGDGTASPCYVGARGSNFQDPEELDPAEVYAETVGGKQYRGEPNCQISEQIKDSMGVQCLPPGRTDNSSTTKGNQDVYTYRLFSMTGWLMSMLSGTTTNATKANLGCGLKSDPARGNQQMLFLNPSPAPLQCVVASGP